MYLIYVDDYGNTGENLADKDQPYFLLCAIAIPEDKWTVLELEIQTTKRNIANALGKRESDFKLHAKDLFSYKNREFRQMPVEDRIAAMTKLFKILAVHEVKIMVSWIEKKTLMELKTTVLEKGDQGAIQFAEKGLSPYILAFGSLVNQVNEYLLSENQYGMMVIDRQSQYAHARHLKAHTAVRAGRSERGGLLDIPLEGDDDHNLEPIRKVFWLGRRGQVYAR